MNGSSIVVVGVRYADQHHRAGQVAGLERLLVHVRVADRLDAHVGAVAVGDRPDVLDGVGLVGVARVGGAEVLGPFELLVVDVDGDDRGGTGQIGAGDRRVADTAASEHGDRVAAPDVAGVHRGAEAGHHAAAEQAGRRGRRLGIDRGALAGVHERLLDEGADAERRRQLGAVGERHLLRGVERREAVPRLALQARPAGAADRPPVEDHVVAGLRRW